MVSPLYSCCWPSAKHHKRSTWYGKFGPELLGSEKQRRDIRTSEIEGEYMKAEQLGPAKGTGEEYPGPRHQWLPECMQNSQSNARDKLQRK
jgi:hypothetical protein